MEFENLNSNLLYQLISYADIISYMDIKETYPLLAEIVETLDLNILGRRNSPATLFSRLDGF